MASGREEALTTILGEVGREEALSQLAAEIAEELGEGLHRYMIIRGVKDREAAEITSDVSAIMVRVGVITGLKFDAQQLNDVIRIEIDNRRAEAQDYDKACLLAVDDARKRFSNNPSFQGGELAENRLEILERTETSDEANIRVEKYKKKREEFHRTLMSTEHQYPIAMIFDMQGRREYFEQNEKDLMTFVADHAEAINQLSMTGEDDEDFYRAIAHAAGKSVESKKIRKSYEEGIILSLSVGRLGRELEAIDVESPLASVSRLKLFEDLRLKLIPDRAMIVGGGTDEFTGDEIESATGGVIRFEKRQILIHDQVLTSEGRNSVESLALKEIAILKALADIK